MIEGLFQPMHLLLILGIALLFFGPKRLPELGKGLGTSIRDFKDAMSGPKPEEKPPQQAGQLEAPKAAVGTTPAASAAPAQTAQQQQPPRNDGQNPPQA
jgi:sec-independent protein translocase protein TatA